MTFGEKENFHVDFSRSCEPLDLSRAIEFAKSPKCGAINVFLGTIRDSDQSPPGGDAVECRQNEPIKAIFYDAYESMARRQILDILEDLPGQDPNIRACVGIRLGLVPVGEASIVICVSSTSRRVSHEAKMTILDQIKSKVVIWKKIIYLDGREEWADTVKPGEAFWLPSPI